MEFTYYTPADDEITVELPTTREVCSGCYGYGTRLREAIGSHAYSREEFEESFDEEEREEYFKRGGMYDTQCWECNGRNVVDVVDEARLEREQPEVFAAWVAAQREEAMCRHIEAQERAMGA